MNVLRRPVRFAGLVLVALLVALTLSVSVVRTLTPRPRASLGWQRAVDLPTPRGETASASTGDFLVVAGGLTGIGSTSAAVDVFRMDENVWQRGAPLPEPRHHAAAAAWGNDIYVSGGARSATSWTPQRQLWRSRPGERWKALAPMPEGRQGHAMVAVAGKLYVIGGVGRTAATLVYDIASRRWSRAAPLPAPRNHLRAAWWHGRIWVLGGRSAAPTSRVDVYDPATGRWTPGPALPQPMSAMAVGVLEDGLHVVGGEDPALIGGGVSDAHYVLGDPSGRWERRPRSLLPVHGAAYGTRPNRLFIAGGAARNGLLSTLAWTRLTQVYVESRKLELLR